MGIGAGTAAAITAATALAGAAVSAVGAIQSGKAQAQQAEYQGEVAANNAKIANQNAEAAAQRGQANVAAQGLKDRAALGRIAAGEAASGIDINTGSPVDVRTSERETGLTDTATQQHNAFLEAYGYQTQSTSFKAQEGLYDAEASQAPIGAAFAAGGDLLSGASSVAGKWSKFQQSGIGS